MSGRDKQAVAASFSKAAVTYDSVAQLQRRLGDEILGLVPTNIAGKALDLGTGTGHFLPLLQQRTATDVMALDLAEGMLAYAREHHVGPHHFIAGDAEQLPLVSASLELVYSNLALQWCEDLPLLFSELYRVLQPGGQIVFTTLVEGTLEELRQAWAAADSYVHVNEFFPESAWLAAAEGAGFKINSWRCQPRQMHYAKVRGLTSELKGLGAHNVNQGRAGGLLGKSRYRALVQAYEKFRDHQGRLPATYQVIFAVIGKGN